MKKGTEFLKECEKHLNFCRIINYTTWLNLIPFLKLCAFVDVFTRERSDKTNIVVKFLPCADYNVVKFECVKADKVIAVASVCFCSKYLELFVTGVSKSYTQRIQGGGGVMGVATPPNDFKKPRPPWSEV